MSDETILIIDDNEMDRKIVSRFLARAGYEKIITADTGEEGIEKAKLKNPDLVITDTMLPGINGFEVCRQLRKNSGSDRPKIIICTGSIAAVDAIEARRAGANDYCVKTSDAEPLIKTVKRLL